MGGLFRTLSLPGLTPYAEALELQRALVEERAQDLIEDTILFLEHTPVVTRGRGLQFTGNPRPRHMPAPAGLPSEVDFRETDRGGDLTYHGPGQLVIYPILKLDGSGPTPKNDIGAYLRWLESWIVRWLSAHGVSSGAHPGATGVWVDSLKIASVGIAVRRWVTYHGAAVNIVNDLAPFRLFSPCGFDSAVMTRLADHSSRIRGTAGWRSLIEKELMEHIPVADLPRTVATCDTTRH